MLSKKNSMVTMVTDEFLENRIILQKSVATIGFIWFFWFQKCILLYIFAQVFLVMRSIRSHISLFRLGFTPTLKQEKGHLYAYTKANQMTTFKILCICNATSRRSAEEQHLWNQRFFHQPQEQPYIIVWESTCKYVQQWMGNPSQLQPTEWAWYGKGGRYFAVLTDKASALPNLLKIIRCNCKNGI